MFNFPNNHPDVRPVDSAIQCLSYRLIPRDVYPNDYLWHQRIDGPQSSGSNRFASGVSTM